MNDQWDIHRSSFLYSGIKRRYSQQDTPERLISCNRIQEIIYADTEIIKIIVLFFRYLPQIVQINRVADFFYFIGIFSEGFAFVWKLFKQRFSKVVKTHCKLIFLSPVLNYFITIFIHSS